jgi:hypothetical protein
MRTETYYLRLTGIDSPSRPPSSRWYHRALAQGPGLQVQLREDDLPQVLRPPASPCDQLPQEEVWSHQPTAPQEEDQVSVSLNEELGEWEAGWRKRGSEVRDFYMGVDR